MPDGATPAEPPASSTGLTGSAAEQRRHRLAKVEALRERGIDPYPVSYPRDHTLGGLREEFGSLDPGAETQDVVHVAGRVMLKRDHGGLVFMWLKDESGFIQIMASRAEMGDDGFGDLGPIDIGDWMGFEGRVVVSRRGELSVLCRTCRLLGKAVRPLPAKTRPLVDTETRARQRYLDLIVTPDARRTADVRTRTLAAIRGFLAGKGFTEVETPVLQPEAGGATARPFITHHNALDIEMYMRIALELHLKRLIVGGYEKVFEMSRVFRNEGIDTRHNPEFTMLEAYQALADYRDMMVLTEEMVGAAAMAAIGTHEIEVGGNPVSLAPPWRRATMYELIKEHTGIDIHPSMPIEEARRIGTEAGVEWEESWGAGKICNEIYDEHVEHLLVGPVFVCDHPREISPLARAHRDDPTLVERFEVVVAGRELANAYSELTDPIDQRERFEDEARAKAAGDPEAGDVDEDYLRAMELGMPPTGGLGVGVDRLVMLLAGATTIRDVLLFPTLRPEAGDLAAPARRLLPLAPAVPRPGPPAPVASAVRTPEPERLRLPGAPRRPATRRGLLAALVAVAGLISLFASLPGVNSRLGTDAFFGFQGRGNGSVAAVIVGLVLLLTARQLARGKRIAFWIATVLLLAGAVLHVLRGPNLIAAALCAALALLLIWFREDFQARGDPPSLLTALRFIPLWLGGVLLYGVVALLIERDRVTPDLSVGGVLETTFGGLIGLDGPYTYESRLFDAFFENSLLALGIAGILLFGFLVLRSLVQRDEVSEEDRERADAIVHAYGSDTLAYFALRDDKSLFFSSDGQAMIAYTYLQGYALVSGDPIGPEGSIPLVVDEFADFCRERAWKLAFLAVREADVPFYAERGLKSMYLGDEAIIRCDKIDIHGPGMKKLRGAVARMARDHSFQIVRETEVPPEVVAELNAISEHWRGKEPERGFTMALSQDVTGESDEMVIALARDSGGKVAGFLRLVPCFGAEPGYSLDLMRREPNAPNGITEYLIVRAAEELGRAGVVRLSMNFAAWGRLFNADAELGPADRALKWVVAKLNPFFQIKSLYDFNEKFQPEWLARSMVFEEAVDLPRVGILYAGVEGFLNVPVVGRLLVPPVVAARGA
ncbi:MAG TPA: lysine--tRNA ligase [Miltoncostaeaceae bacterium]|nr:lysine--tRNA ligase [Miltoncostaeaceae bacterium]